MVHRVHVSSNHRGALCKPHLNRSFALPPFIHRCSSPVPGLFRCRALSSQQKEVAPSSGWYTFWTAVDASAWIGTIGTAIAFLITQEFILAGAPVLLPILALFANRQRDKLDATYTRLTLEEQIEFLAQRIECLSLSAATDVAAEVRAAVDAQPANAERTLKALEAKLSAMEGSFVSAGSAVRESLKESASAQNRSSKELLTKVEAAASQTQKNIVTEFRQVTADELAALGRLEARIAGLEGAVGGLEVAQGEGLRRLGTNLSAMITDAEAGLQSAVREEAWRSLDPVRRLPQLLAQVAQQREQQQQQQQQQQLLPELSEDSLRALIKEQLTVATSQFLSAQEELLEEIKGVENKSVDISANQWNQLGRRLMAMDEQLRELKTVAKEPASATGVATPLLEEQLSALQGDIGRLTDAVQSAFTVPPSSSPPLPSTLRNALLSVQTALAELPGNLAVSAEKGKGSSYSALDSTVFDQALIPAQKALEVALGYQTAGDYSTEDRQGSEWKAALENLSKLTFRLDEVTTILVGLKQETSSIHPSRVQQNGTENGRNGNSEVSVPIHSWLSSTASDDDDDDDDDREEDKEEEQQPVATSAGAVSTSPGALIFGSSSMTDSRGLHDSASTLTPFADTTANDANVEQEEEVSALGFVSQKESMAKTNDDKKMSGEDNAAALDYYTDQGLRLLKAGRAQASSPGADLGVADSAFWEAAECFERALESDPSSVRALGNLGNVLMSHGRLKWQMLGAVRATSLPKDSAAAAAVEASMRRLSSEAEELLLLAGRRYRQVLELDPRQPKALINWGKVVCLRAEIARESGNLREAGTLFDNAAEKFDAAGELLLPQSTSDGSVEGDSFLAALKLAGRALFNAGVCQAELGDSRAAKGYLRDAERAVNKVLSVNRNDEEAAARLEDVMGWMKYVKSM